MSIIPHTRTIFRMLNWAGLSSYPADRHLMGIPVGNPCLESPELCSCSTCGQRAGSWPVLVTAKGSLWGPQHLGSLRWPHIEHLWEICRLSNPTTWIFQSACLEWSRFFASGLDLSDNLLFRILYKFYLLFSFACITLYKEKFQCKSVIILEDYSLSPVIQEYPKISASFWNELYKNPPIYAHFHN